MVEQAGALPVNGSGAYLSNLPELFVRQGMKGPEKGQRCRGDGSLLIRNHGLRDKPILVSVNILNVKHAITGF
jgi:hypothetical protein